MTEDQRFRREEHLRSRSDFARVYAARLRKSDGRLVVYVAQNGLKWSRLGLSVSRRLGNAVRRNYLRRRIREAFRTAKSELPQGWDIVCVTRPGVADTGYNLAGAFRELVVQAARGRQGRAKIIRPAKSDTRGRS